MATVITYTRTDSLDPRIASDVEDVVFYNPLTGEKLEIQLGAANRKHFENHLTKIQKYIDAAVVVAEPVVETKPKAAAKNSENTKIRVWARENGFTIGDRGRISAEIMTAYTAAQEVIYPDAEVVETVTREQALDEALKAGAEAVQAELDATVDVDAKLTEVLEMAADGPTEAEVASTEAEILKAYDDGKLTSQAVMELLDEIAGE